MYKFFIVTFCFSTILSGCSTLFRFDYDPVQFKVSGDTAIMTGVIDGRIEETLRTLLDENPQIKTIEMQYVEGSVDDEANLSAARYVRSKGLNTHIPNNGLVASGGTDFFLAGIKRTAGLDAKIGVHSWSGGHVEAIKLSKSHPEHRKYLDYYQTMGIPIEFYWYTLEVAPSDSIHWMSVKEQKRYKLTTQ